MCIFRCLVKLLVVIGALNWGLVGFFQYNLVADVFGGEFTTAARTVFAIVGLAGVFFALCWISKCCKSSCNSCACGKGGSCACNKGSCVCSRGSCGPCNCSPNCPRCSCNRNKHEQ